MPNQQINRPRHLIDDIGGEGLHRQRIRTQPCTIAVSQQIEPVNLPTQICKILSDTPPGQPAGLDTMQQHHRWSIAHKGSRSLIDAHSHTCDRSAVAAAVTVPRAESPSVEHAVADGRAENAQGVPLAGSARRRVGDR